MSSLLCDLNQLGCSAGNFGGLFAPHRDRSLQQLALGKLLAGSCRLFQATARFGPYPRETSRDCHDKGISRARNLQLTKHQRPVMHNETTNSGWLICWPDAHPPSPYVGVQAALGNDCQVAHVGIGGSLLLPENRRLGLFLVSSGDRFWGPSSFPASRIIIAHVDGRRSQPSVDARWPD